MKKKVLKKKLMLRKKTIANLGDSEMEQIAGGTIPVTPPTPPNPAPVAPTFTNCYPCSNTNCGWTVCYTCTGGWTCGTTC